MPYKLKPKTMYLMPTHFGPMSGPRQGPGGEMGAFGVDERKSRRYSVSFLTERGAAWRRCCRRRSSRSGSRW